MKMMKFVFIFCVAIALLQQSQAFKVITVYKGVAPPPSAAATAPAAPALDIGALLQGLQSAVGGKLKQIQALIQQKSAFKQNAFKSLQSTLGGLKKQFGSLAGSAKPGLLIQKQVYIGVPKSGSATSTNADSKTTAN